MKKRATQVMTWIGAVILAVGLLAAAVAGSGKRAVRMAYEALEADGRPLRPEQVIPPRIPDSENAALIYESVVLQLQAEEAGESGLFNEASDLASSILDGLADDEGVKRFRILMDRESVRQAMAQLERGSLRRGCRYDLDYSKGAELLLPHVSELRTLSKIVSAWARVAAADGKAEESWDIAIVALRLADALRDEPILVSQLVRAAQFHITADMIQTLTEQSLPNPEQHAELVSLLTRFEDMGSLILALDGERILFGEWGFSLPPHELLALFSFGSDVPGPAILSPLLSLFLNHDHAAYLEAMRVQTKLATQPYSIEAQTRADALYQKAPVYCVLTRLVLPALGTARARLFGTVGMARVTRAGLVVLHQASSADAYPEGIEGIEADGLIDPFTNSPLIYRKTESGFVVYSVGPDAKDDGGVHAKSWKEGDIVWQYPPKGK